MYDLILGFLTAFAITFFTIPPIIRIAKHKLLYDEMDERRAHSSAVPTLGGIGIFAGCVFALVFWTPFDIFGNLQYILCAFILIFLVGAKDDIMPMPPAKKILGQAAAAAILVIKSDIRLTSMYGLLGINELSYWPSIFLSLFCIVLLVNAFNLIDGINGLAGMTAFLIGGVFGTWFFLVDRADLAMLAFAMSGSTLAFLFYNMTPASIFMGDTGSMLLGLISSILAVAFVEYNREIILLAQPMRVDSAPAIAAAVLVLPVYDALRAFTLRLLAGRSPFKPDKGHIHHMLLNVGLSHMQATVVLLSVNVVFICFAFFMQDLGNARLMLLMLALAITLSTGLRLLVRRRRLWVNQVQPSGRA